MVSLHSLSRCEEKAKPKLFYAFFHITNELIAQENANKFPKNLSGSGSPLSELKCSLVPEHKLWGYNNLSFLLCSCIYCSSLIRLRTWWNRFWYYVLGTYSNGNSRLLTVESAWICLDFFSGFANNIVSRWLKSSAFSIVISRCN